MEDEEEVEREKRRKTREPTEDTDESPTEETKPQTSRCENNKNDKNYTTTTTLGNFNGLFMLSTSTWTVISFKLIRLSDIYRTKCKFYVKYLHGAIDLTEHKDERFRKV